MTPNIFDREVPPLKRRVPLNGSIEKICASIQQAQKSFSTSASGKPSRFAVSPKISARVARSCSSRVLGNLLGSLVNPIGAKTRRLDETVFFSLRQERP